MSSNPYVYYAQSRSHPRDPFYAKVFTGDIDMYEALKGFEDDYIVFCYDPWGGCKAIELP